MINITFITGYTKRKSITIDYTKVSAALSNFPALISISADTDIGASALSTGYDIRFTSSDETTLLDYERISFSIVGGSCTALFWVRIPSLSNTVDTVIYIYYGKSDATDGENKTGVWDSNFVGVWHLNENGSTAGDYKDSTSNNNNSTNSTLLPTQTTNGKILNAQTFDGSEDCITFGNGNVFDFTGEFHISAWIYQTVLTEAYHCILSHRKSDTSGAVINLYTDYNRLYCEVKNDTRSSTLSYSLSTPTVAINTWVHIGLSRDSSNNVYIWKDGASYLAGNVTGPITNFDKEFGIGCQVNTSNSQWFTGRIDEVRLSKAARSSGWSETEVANQNNPSAFIKSFGTEETYTAINFYPIIQYNEDNEMFQIAGTSKAHPVQIRSLTSGDLLPPEQQTNPVFTVYVNGTLSEETVTMSAFNATMLRNLITVPDTLAVNAYDSVEINVSCDNDGSGFMMVNIVPDPATTGTTAQQVWEYSGTRALTTAPPTASAISDYIWTAASSRTLTAVPTGVALEATLTDMKGSGFAATDSLKDIKASLSSVTVDITGLATTTNITDAVAAIRGAAGTETLDTIAADIAAISVTGGSSAEQIIPATYITLGAAEKTITLASPYNTISKEQVLFIQDLNTGDIIYNSKFPRVNPITVEGGVITYTHPSEEIVSSPTSDIIQICVNKV